MTETNLYFKVIENGTIKYKMIDIKSDFYGLWYNRCKNCDLVLESKALVPMDKTTKRYGYKYTYNIVPDVNDKFKKCQLVDKRILSDDYDYKIIEEFPKKLNNKKEKQK
jgi:hypothetical protein